VGVMINAHYLTLRKGGKHIIKKEKFSDFVYPAEM
jgi:hypothetical protein